MTCGFLHPILYCQLHASSVSASFIAEASSAEICVVGGVECRCWARFTGCAHPQLNYLRPSLFLNVCGLMCTSALASLSTQERFGSQRAEFLARRLSSFVADFPVHWCLYSACSPDLSTEYADRLFAPFSQAEFPTMLEPMRLQHLLCRAPATSIPTSPAELNLANQLWTDRGHPLFTPALADETAVLLCNRMIGALAVTWPNTTPSELRFTTYWDTIGCDLPAFASEFLGFEAFVYR